MLTAIQARELAHQSKDMYIKRLEVSIEGIKKCATQGLTEYYSGDFFCNPNTEEIKEKLEKLGYKIKYADNYEDAIISW